MSRGVLLVAALAIAVIVGSFLLRPGPPESAIDDNRPGDTRSDELPSESATPQAKKKRPKKLASQAPGLEAGNFPGLGAPPGLSGEGMSQSLPSHRMTLRLTSPNPIGWTGYIIPTSTQHPEGSSFVEGNSWSLSTTVYGDPDYGVVFLQAGADGRPATCEITIDGQVTDRRTTKGPYGTVWCQG